MGGLLTFAATRSGDKIAPKAVIAVVTRLPISRPYCKPSFSRGGLLLPWLKPTRITLGFRQADLIFNAFWELAEIV
jgi:hypothetical protein